MAVFVNTFFEKRVDQLFDLAQRVEQAFRAAGLEYRVAGGLATYLYMEEVEPDAGRLTRDIDIVVRREDLQRIAAAVEPFGLEYRHAAGVDMLAQAGQPSVRRAVHLVFSGEKVRQEYPEPAPEFGQGSGRSRPDHSGDRSRPFAGPARKAFPGPRPRVRLPAAARAVSAVPASRRRATF